MSGPAEKRRLVAKELALAVVVACLAASACGSTAGSRMRSSALEAAAPTTELVRDSGRIRIESMSSYWTGLFGDEAMNGPGIDAPEVRTGRGELFVISGVLRNTWDVALRAVSLAFELHDADGRVVHRQDGYNYGAESLVGASPESPPAVVPIAPGAEDRFRMILFGSELPPFERVTVRVIAAHRLAVAAPAASPR